MQSKDQWPEIFGSKMVKRPKRVSRQGGTIPDWEHLFALGDYQLRLQLLNFNV